MFHRRNRQDRHHTVVPARMICLSFLLVIVAGALLLMLPISSKSGVSPAPIDALFTATSATCVTGLIVFDTFTQWTIFGQSVILMLIQLGGLGLVSFTTFFTLSLRGKLGLREMRLAGEQMNFGSINGVQSLLNIIIKVTFGCEAVGALLLMIRMIPMFGVARGVYTSVFLAVSAYCNAGFDVLGPIGPTGSLSVFSGDWLVLGVLGILIIIGGLGFIVFNDIFTSRLRGERQHLSLIHI